MEARSHRSYPTKAGTRRRRHIETLQRAKCVAKVPVAVAFTNSFWHRCLCDLCNSNVYLRYDLSIEGALQGMQVIL